MTNSLPETDPYAALGVPRTATPSEITRAYRDQLRAHHPDLRSRMASSPAEHSAADERLQQILDAYALLRDPLRRAEYDARCARAIRVIATDSAPKPITITRVGDRSPPLRAGPVRRHRTR